MKNGILINDISDHLPVFTMVEYETPKKEKKHNANSQSLYAATVDMHGRMQKAERRALHSERHVIIVKRKTISRNAAKLTLNQ